MKKALLIVMITIGVGVTFAADVWVVKNSGTVQNLDAVWFVNPQNGWVVGDAGTLLKTTDGGETWSKVALTNEDLNDAVFVNESLGLIVGDKGRIFRTVNGGAAWMQVASGTAVNLEGVSFGSGGFVYAAGRDGVILRSMDGGESWSQVASGSERWRAVFAFGSQHAWAVGNDGAIKATADGGATWTTQSTGASSDLKDVFFSDANNGWVVGQNDAAYKTVNGGAAWTLSKTGINSSLEGVVFLNSLYGAAVGNAGRTFTTENGGQSWVLQQSPVDSELDDLFVASPNLAWAVGQGGVILKRGSISTRVQKNLPNDFFLSQNYPNPFNPETTIAFYLPKSGEVNLTIYNSAGQAVRTLVEQNLGAGFHQVLWHGSDNNDRPVGSGTYFYTLKSGGLTWTRRMLLIK